MAGLQAAARDGNGNVSTEDPPTAATEGRPLGSAMNDASRLIRPMALLAVSAMILAQAISPALKGIAMGLDRVIDRFDIAAGVGSHLLAITASALSIGLILLLARDRNVNIFSRILLIAQTTVILVLGVPAARFRLSPFACFFVGLVAVSLAVVGSVEGVRQARSRAAGIVLAITAMAALFRMIPAAILALASPERADRFAGAASALSSMSLVLFASAVFVSLAWTASQAKKMVSPVSLVALSTAMFFTWGAARGLAPSPPTWTLFAARAIEALRPLPASRFPATFELFVAVLAPVAAIALLATRKQMPAVLGAISLTLTAGTMPDVPGRALILALASLSVVLASRDDRGMWAALLGRPLAPPSSPNDA